VGEAGCRLCFGEDAELAWASYRRLRTDAAVVDESHFLVRLRSCPECGQRFLWIFTEFVDWENGEDAQYRQIVPVTKAEADAIARQGAAVDLAYLGSLGRGRRYLKVDWPSAQPKATAGWATGEFLIIPGH
jgi:hypothetical protein